MPMNCEREEKKENEPSMNLISRGTREVNFAPRSGGR